MKDEAVVDELRSHATTHTPVQLAMLLDELAEDGLSQGTMISFFKRAFPAIPLRVLLHAGGWRRLSSGGLTDADFDALLAPWLSA